MNRDRYVELDNGKGELTLAEVAQGWHFCDEWDGLLVGPGMAEMECCGCFEGPEQLGPWHN